MNAHVETSSVPPVAVLGSGGRLGSSLSQAWHPEFPLLTFARSDLDVSDLRAVEKTLAHCADSGVKAVFNATGLTNLETCEDEPDLARRINAESVARMAACSTKHGMRLIHFSTDYVFDGQKEQPYLEEDAPAPLSVYGQTKLEGEEAVLQSDGSHLVFRVAWVFGPGRPAFPDMVINRALGDGEVAVVADKWASPTSADDVAEWLRALARAASDPGLPGGLFHLCNTGVCSWMDYAVHALETARSMGLPVSTTTPQPLSLASMKMFRAPRPVHTGMDNTKFQRVFGCSMRSWREALAEYIHQQFSTPAGPGI